MAGAVFYKKGTVNPDYYNLDLFLDDKFYEQFNPVIITLKNPIHYKEEKNSLDLSLPEHTVSQFIVRKKDFEHFLKKHNSFVLEKPNTQERKKISIDDVSFDLNNNHQKEVIRILNEPKVSKQTDIFLISNDSFIDIGGYHYKKFFIPPTLSALLNKGMSKETFLEFVLPEEINMATFVNFTQNDKNFDLMKSRLGKDLAPFFMKVSLNLAQINSSFNTVEISEDIILFSEKWQIIYEKTDENKSNFMLLFQSHQWDLSKKEYLDYAANLILSKSQRCSEHHFENKILKHLSELEPQDFTYIVNKLDKCRDFEEMGQNIKGQVENWIKAKQPKEKLISKDGKFRILREIHWQQLTVENFNSISSVIKAPEDFYENMKIKCDELDRIYPAYKKSAPVLVKMFELLQETRKSVDLWCGLDDCDATYNAKHSVYINEKGLFIELNRENDNRISNEILHKIVDIAIEYLTIEKITDYESLNKEIGNIILKANMDKVQDKDNQQGLDDNTNYQDFKI